MSQAFDPYQRWLDISPHERPIHAYRLLGLELFEADSERIEQHAAERMAEVRKWQQGAYGELSQRVLTELAQARVNLLDPARRATYDQRLRSYLEGRGPFPTTGSHAPQPSFVSAKADAPIVAALATPRPAYAPPPGDDGASPLLTWALVAVSVLGFVVLSGLAIYVITRPAEIAPPIVVVKPADVPVGPTVTPTVPEMPPRPPEPAVAEPPVAEPPVAQPPVAQPAPESLIGLPTESLQAGIANGGPTEPLEASRPPEGFCEAIQQALTLANLPPIGGVSRAAPPLAIAPFDAATAKRHQADWAAHLGAEIVIENEIGLKLVLIPPGEFEMGSPAGEEKRGNGEVLHKVRITKPFYLGVYEVTQGEYQQVIGANPSWFSPAGTGRDRVVGVDTARLPMEMVSWANAVEFCRRLGQREGQTYRLPTEAEWEYACRAGTTTPFHFGASLNGDRANVNGFNPYGTPRSGRYLDRTTTVGSYPPNPFGLYDMHGNVWEWCQDWYGGDQYYADQAGVTTDDPIGNTRSQTSRIMRGGTWNGVAWVARSAHRATVSADFNYHSNGFRVVRVP